MTMPATADQRVEIRRARAIARGSERGAILPIMALLLIALLTMAAIAVDLGGARETRRRNQGSVDASALGAAQDLPGTPPARFTTAVNAAISNLSTNLGITVAQAAADLNSCGAGSSDPNALAVTASSSNAGADENCITFDAGGGSVRVYYRGTYKTAFGGVVGTKSLTINTGATATKSTKAGFGGVLPFGLPAGAGVGEACLKTMQGGAQVGACNTGSTSGNRFYLDVAQYGNTTLGTPQRCNTGSHDALLRDNIAMGIDHLLTNYNGTTSQDAYSNCVYTPGPNALTGETGSIAGIITGPMLTDTSSSMCGGSPCESDSSGARLGNGRGDIFVCSGNNDFSGWSSPYSCGTVEGVHADDVPLWHFIGSGSSHVGLSDVPDSCQYKIFTDGLAADTSASVGKRELDMRTLLDTCFSDYEKGGTPVGCTAGHSPCQGTLFGLNTKACGSANSYDIQCTPRFGYTPVVCNTLTSAASPFLPCLAIYPSGSSGNVFIVTRQPIYLQRLTNDNAADDETNDKGNSLDFEPGVNYTRSATNESITNIIGYSFDRKMLPGRLGDPDAPNETDVNVFISLIR